MSVEQEDEFPSACVGGGRGRIPQRLLDKAEGDVTRAFILWWAEADRKGMQRVIEDLQR